MKKKIAIALMIVIIISAIVPNFIFAAVDLESLDGLKDTTKDSGALSQDSATSLFEEGKADVTPSNGRKRTEKLETTSTMGNYVGSVMAYMAMNPPMLVNIVLTYVIATTQEGITDLGDYMVNHRLTIESIVLGRYDLFDINFFRDINKSGTGVTSTIKKNVVKWYFALRYIALAISLLVLIYVGIRMTLSTVASDRAKYKKMLISWFTSIILLFTMHYIVIIMLTIQETVLRALNASLLSGEGFEDAIINDTTEAILNSSGWNKVPFVILYWVLVYYQVKFFVMYFKRYLSMGFLTLISPLVTVTYPIDKVGDGRAQAFSTWLREIIYNIVIQVVHALIYIVFIFSAAEIVKKVPMLGIIFLMALSRAERVVKSTFSLKGEGFGDYKPLDRIKGLIKGG